jgi:hypothetical protein
MNLGKLLAAGKSIIGGRGEIAYRISDRAYLPKFISSKNPFAPAAKVEPAPKVVVAPIKKGMASDGTKTQKLPTFPAARFRKTGWISKFNPISIWRGSRPQTPQKAQPPLQAELSLDRVKVVHNDLSDADVEIVPIKSRTAAEAVEPILPPAHGGDSWGRLSAKIFGAKTA